MTVEEIFSHLSAHMTKGLMIHDQLAKAFNFLNLCGYSKCHQYHYIEESYNYRSLINFYFKHYNKLILEEKVEKPEIIPNNWYKYSRQEVNTSEKRSAVKQLMKKWVDWEKETNALLQKSYKQLFEINEICSMLKISDFLRENSKELAAAEEKQINLEVSGYNIDTIIQEQKELYHKYCQSLRYKGE